jgi:hypothetical protein
LQRRCQPARVCAEAEQLRRQRRRSKPHPLQDASLCHAACSRSRQIFVCAFGAVFSATFYLLDYRLLLWRRSGEKSKEVDGDRVWKDLRLFSGWMCTGCVTGIISFLSFLQLRNCEYDSVDMRISRHVFYELQASLHRWFTAYHVFHPVYVLCIIHAMNTLLRRVSDHASHSYYNTARDLVDPNRSSTVKRFDWRDCIGQYAISIFLSCQTVTL